MFLGILDEQANVILKTLQKCGNKSKVINIE